METIFQPEDDGIRNLIEVVITGLFSILAYFSLLTIISQINGLSFHTYAILGCIGCILIIFVFIYFLYRHINFKNINRGAFFLLILTALISSALASISHRKSSDDFFYIPNVIYMLDHPQDPMSFEVHFFEGGDQCELISHTWGTSVSFDYLRGAVAHILHIDFLFVYFLLTSILVSFLIPLALYYAASIVIDQPFEKVVGVFFSLGVIFLLCETHRTFGNFSVTRAHQGKTLLLAVGIPFLIGITVRYFISPSFYRWMTIVITSTAMVGATSSAIVILPMLGLLICVAYLSSREWKDHSLKNLLLYGSGFFILVGYALFLYINTSVDLGTNSPVNQNFPTTFEGHWSLMFNQNNPRTLQILVISTAISIFSLKGRSRRFLIIWILAVILIFLNPLIAPLLITYITSPNIYWRLFYLYPFPFVLLITFAAIGKFLQTKRTWIKWTSFILLTGILLLSFRSNSFLSIFRYTPSQLYFPPGYKLPTNEITLAKEIVNQIPEGPMLAPIEISGVIPIFSSQHPQMIIRSEEVRLWLSACNLPDQIAENRLGAASFIGGDPEGFQDFQEFLEIESYTRSIVIANDMNSDTVNKLLNTYGYTNQNAIGSYQTYWR